MSNFKSKIATALENIGTRNGHAAPESQDPIDALLHEYNVAAIGEAHFKKRRDNAKDALTKTLSTDAEVSLNDCINSVAKTEISTHIQVARGQHYTLDIFVKTGASFFDASGLKNYLLKSMTTDEVNKIWDMFTLRRAPSKTFNVIENGD